MMKHLKYIALGAAIVIAALVFILALGYLAETLGTLVILIPMLIGLLYALGRIANEAYLIYKGE